MSLKPGTHLAQYEIIAPLGAGGMGEVYRARDSRLDRDVAIKVLSDHLLGDPAMQARFEREAKSVAALSHPGILGIHELAIVEGRSFAVMELLEGESLRAAIARGPMPWRRAIEIGAETADALAAAHDRGIIHRDLKPENVFITSEGRAKILDFGLARSKRSILNTFADSVETAVAVTEPGMVLGTIGYMSPEQVRGEEANAPADIFALGCILYEMVRGLRAFTGGSAAETMASILRENPMDLSESQTGAPLELARVVAHCLEKDPEERFQSASDVASALRALLVDSGIALTDPTRRRRARATGKSLAVLPFLNLSADPAIEYLIDGITESIINGLSQLPKLRVVPRSTAFRYKGREVDVKAVGLALNVKTLVMGRVVQYGDVLNIQAELVDVASESQLWGDQYKRQISDIMTFQEEIAWQILEALRIRLTGEQKKRLTRRSTQNAEAYQEYLRGRYFWNKWTAPDFLKAVEHFERAIEKDPTYALAYAGLADTYGALGYYGFVPPKIALPRSKAAALRALALDNTLAEAHTTMALSHLFTDWNWVEAERELQKSVELNPRYAHAWSFYSLLLVARGRSEQAIEYAKRGEAADPLSPVNQMSVAWAYYFSRRFDEADTQMQYALQMNPGNAQAQNVLVMIADARGEHLKAIATMELFLPTLGIPPELIATLRTAFAQSEEAYWAARLNIFERLSASAHVPSYLFAVLHGRAGHRDEAIRWLERMIDERAGQAVFLAVDPAIDSVRTDPRFAELVRRVEQGQFTTA